MTAEGRRRVAAILAVAVGAIVIGGLFFPWAGIGSLQINGLDLGQGNLVFLTGIIATSAIAGWGFGGVRGVRLPLVALGSSLGAGRFSITGVRDIMEANSISSGFGFERKFRSRLTSCSVSTLLAALSLLAAPLGSPRAEPASG